MSDIVAPKPKEGEPWDVAIIGSGPAALTAAVYTTRGAISTLVIAGNEWGGQLMLTTTVDNFPGFPKGIMGPDLMTNMRAQAERFGAEIVGSDVTSVNYDNKPFEITANEKIYKAKTVIIATGAETVWLGVPGEDRLRGRGVSSCAPCDAPFFVDKEVFVVGGGDSAMEEALVLTKYSPKVTIVHRRNELRASAAMQKKVLENEKIDIIWNTEIIEMLGDQKLEAAVLRTEAESDQGKQLDETTKKMSGERVGEKDGYIFWKAPTEGIFVAIGHKPATEVFSKSIETDEKGYIKRKASEGFRSATNVPGVFVAGDVHDKHYRQAITAAAFGCMAGMDVLKFLDQPRPSW